MSQDSAFEVLLNDLRALSVKPGGAEFNRKNVVALLQSLTLHLGDALAIPAGVLDDDVELFLDHPVATQLKSLSSAFGDLDIGITDDIFKPYSHGSNAARPWWLRERDKVLVECLADFQRHHGIAQQKQAAMQLAKTLKVAGYRRKGEMLTWRQIIDLRNRYKNK